MNETIARRDFLGLSVGAALACAIASLSPENAWAEEEKKDGAAEGLEFTTEEVFLDYNGGKTRCVLRRPVVSDGKQVPAALFAHGYSATCDKIPLYVDICEGLAKHGIASLAINYTSNGGSDLPFEDHSVKTDVEQAHIAIDYLRDLDWVSEVGMMGQSQGGCGTCIAASECGENPLAFTVLFAPANMIPDVARAGSYDLADPSYDALNVFYFDPAIEHDSDEMLGAGVKYSYFEQAQDVDMWDVCRKVTSPTLLLWCTGDVPVSLPYAVRTQENIPDCAFHVFEGSDHNFTGREADAVAQTLEFLGKVLA